MSQPLTFEHQNILVTGGAGFIGSHLCEYLLKEGHRVICVDNLSTGDAKNIDTLLQNANFRFIRLDINMPFDLESFSELAPFKLPFQGIQQIYHLACPTSIKNFDQFKIQTLLSNSLGNYHILELAKKYRAKILLGSSSVVYGERKDGAPLVEEEEKGIVDHLTPRACYDEGKRFSETMFETYRQVHSLEIRVARIFRTFGPRMPLFDGQLIPDFILHALDGKDLILYGGKGFKTSLAYITDVIDGLVRIMEAKEYAGPINLGSDVDLSLEEVANQIIAMTNSTSKVVEGENFVFLSELALPRIDRAKELGWFPLVRLEDGLRQTIEYMKANKLLLSSL
ncbi:NAD-dependent dehydratase [Candidatus Uhrbacteria bacterium CG10_big_fil_rev_8_21_14_0_10_48_16]|uniref:NAD-dependent dehydratase n=1 Tax=Candidatus Uhrbacteria bacterium CG10_big_fil_rev_8_21_14_0_10_48_16 TaxID=1975038 RepID=A0A2M8LG50_9BACT|nr:MAG: NAD-dependent dehydratase [Candidatus Uhrbacteria bacterium CG10_big_fil_rev_8_21_14_0_10_48_16]